MFTPLRFVLRALKRSPAFTTTAVLVLGVGIGANTVVFSALDALLFRPLPYGKGDRLVLLGERDKASGLRAGTSMAAWREWHDYLHSFEDLAAIDPELTVAVGDAGTYVSAARVSTNFFALLQVTPIRGRGFLIDDGAVTSAAVVLVSEEEFWRRALGAPQSLAEQWLAINHRPHTVIGVLPAGFKFTYARFRRVAAALVQRSAHELCRPEHSHRRPAAAGSVTRRRTCGRADRRHAARTGASGDSPRVGSVAAVDA